MYQTNQEVPASGIYKVHHQEHRLTHEVILIAGQRFPRCGRCSQKVRFEMVKAAPYLSTRSSIIVHEMSAQEPESDEQCAA